VEAELKLVALRLPASTTRSSGQRRRRCVKRAGRGGVSVARTPCDLRSPWVPAYEQSLWPQVFAPASAGAGKSAATATAPARIVFRRGTQTSGRVGAKKGLRGHWDRLGGESLPSLERRTVHVLRQKKTPRERGFSLELRG